MTAFVRFPIEGGGSILVEGAQSSSGPVKAGRLTDAVEDATETLQGALASVKTMAAAVMQQFREVGPDQVELEFGIELNAQAGAVITKLGAGSHLTVKLTWKGEADPPA